MHLLAVVAACQTSMPRPNRGLELSAAGATISNRAQNGSTSELQTSQSEYIIQPATSVARWTALKTKSAKGAGGGAGWHAFLGVYDIRCIIYIYMIRYYLLRERKAEKNWSWWLVKRS